MRKGSILKAGTFLAAGVLAWTMGQGCSSPCLQVQEVLCQCQGRTQTERNTCLDNASSQEKLQPPSEANQTTCEGLLPGCEALIDGGGGCAALQTSEGRKACGLAPK